MPMNENFEPTRAMTLILLALVGGPLHGYVIMSEVVTFTDYEFSIAAGTLYRSLAVLRKEELVEEAPELFDPETDDARRKYYRITAEGRLVLNVEIERLSWLVTVAQKLLKAKADANG